MLVRAKSYGNSQDFDDMDMFDNDAEFEGALSARSGHGLAPILEPDDDYDDFDASELVGRAYH